MSRSEPLVVAVAGFTLCVVVWQLCADVPPLGSSLASNEAELPQPSGAKVATPHPLTAAERESAKTNRADKLFDQQEWSKARSAYDEVVSAQRDWYSPVARWVVERAIRCSLKLRDGDDALRRAVSFQSRLKPRDVRDGDDWPPLDDDLSPLDVLRSQELAAARRAEELAADIAHLEFVHRMFDEIANQARAAGDARLRSRWTTARMALDFQLLKRLDRIWSSGHPDMKWWWEGVPEAEAYFEQNNSRFWWYSETGIPLDFDGKLLVLAAPTKYRATLGGGEKALFLLSEIERLDPSISKDDAARALLYRAELARRLYGPNSDPAWSHVEANNSLPSFRPRRSGRNLKAFWDLEDDEARTMVGHRTKVIMLPYSESPLALLRSLQAKYPNSRIVPEAIYQCGSYYQRRRQFSKAAAEYDRLIARFPKHVRAKSAKEQLKRIEHADVLLAETGVYPAGDNPKLWMACRNTEKVDFTAQRFDLEKYVKEQVKHGNWWGARSLVEDVFDDASDNDDREKYLDPGVITWSQSVPKSDQVTSHSTLAPLAVAGAYIVEARVSGAQEPSRGLVVVTSVAIVQKPLFDKLLLWVVDSRTGRPLVNRTVQILNRGTTLTTDEDGLIAYTPKEMTKDSAFALVVGEDHSIAYCELAGLGYSEFAHIQHEYCSVTDRPVYRPSSTVHFRIWARKLVDRKVRPAESGLKLRLTVTVAPGTAVGGPIPAGGFGGGFFSVSDADENNIKTMELETDRFGSVSGSFKLSNETPLGEYRLILEDGYAGGFRVEEYKKPEFEVTVTPAKNRARLGEFVKAKVKARYYFGVPVSKAQVRYHILRRRYRFRYAIPRKFDWLYGNGYGTYKSSFPRPADSTESAEANWGLTDAAGFESQSRGEVVGEGTAHLKDDGTAEITIDTSAGRDLDDLGDFDQQYTIHVEVRDASRRTVEGVGTVLVTRRQFSAFVELDRGWYQSGGEALVDGSTRTANNFPVSAEGKLSLHRVTLGGANSAEAVQKADQTWNIKTGVDGHFALKFSVPTAGRYRLVFATQDARKQTVTGTVNFWVYDPNVNGKRFRFHNLEMIPDRRSYKVGETARLLVNTAQPNARLLLFDSLGQYRFIDVPNHSDIVEVRIEDRHVPNHFVEATLIRNGHTYVRSCELFVPPVKDLLKVELQPDKVTFKPGESRHVRVKVSDADGNPVSGEVTLAAYDKALTYIQDDYDMGPISLISRRNIEYWSNGVYSTVGTRKFETTGDFLYPEFRLDDDGWAQSIFGEGDKRGGLYFFGITLSLVIRQTQRGHGESTISDVVNAGEDGEELSGDDIFADLVQPEIRTNFVDTAIWLPHLVLDQHGIAEAEIIFPESLTTWRIRGYVVTKSTQVGDATSEVITSKNLLVRLQSPRFFVERDEVVLSANVHNYLQSAKSVTAEMIVPAELFQFLGDTDKTPVADGQGNLHLFGQALVKPGAEHRFDWPLRVLSDGLATITVKALTNEDSDAMRLAFPVRPHGVLQTQSQTGFFQVAEVGEKSLSFELPRTIHPDKTRIELTLTPSAAATAFDAIPFLVGYPHGCVEQTMSRFYPTILAADTLKKMGTDLETIATKVRERNRTRRNRVHLSPVFDSSELQRMSEAGLQRLYRFQHDDGGWGWWQHDGSSPYMTAYVLLGLDTAANAGMDVRKQVYASGVGYLIESLKPSNEAQDQLGNVHQRALAAYVLSLDRSWVKSDSRVEIREVLDAVYRDRNRLNNYGQALLALTMHNRERLDKAMELLGGILKTVQIDDKLAKAWIPTSASDWWHWYNSDIETNAWVLRALVAIDPTNELAPQIVNWLASERQHGHYWRSTRDTALAVHALAEFLLVLRQTNADYVVAVRLDGQHLKDIRVSWQNMLEMDNRISVAVANIHPRQHRITLSKERRGPLFYSMTVQYLETKPDRIRATGNGISIQRRYFKLRPRPVTASSIQHHPRDSTPQRRTQLKFGDTVAIGETIEVELSICADQTYKYMAFEDPKPAGCEPIQLRSGYTWGDGLCSNVELRDENVVFFMSWLPKGKHVVHYKLRAEATGQFHALPTNGFAMYAPEIRARSDAIRLGIHD